MKRTLALLVTLAGLAVAASPASAAGWTGVVIAKDGPRKAVVTASADGTVRTARSPKAASLRVGQRLSVSGATLADGTYRAASIRVTGRASVTKVKAVVIRNQRAQKRLLVSAGGSTFALARRGATRTLAIRSDRAPKPGDQIVATVAVGSGTPLATSVTTVGHLATIEVEGIVTKISDGSIELIVAKAGFVTIAVPAGFKLPAGLKAFDEVKLVVSVAADGKLTAIAAQAEHDEDDAREDEDDNGVDLDDDDHELEVEGKITALSATSITVQPGSVASAVTCALTKPLTGFAVGNLVELECVAAVGGALTLKKIEREDDEHEDDENDDDDDDDDDDDEDEDEDDKDDD